MTDFPMPNQTAAVAPGGSTRPPRRVDAVTGGRCRVLPGFGLMLGFTLLYLSLIVLIPLSTIFLKGLGLGWPHFVASATSARALAAYELTFVASLGAAAVNAVMGLLVAWVLVRYTFPGRRLVDAVIDFPLALPTAVAGITLTTLYAEHGWLGSWLALAGIKVAYTRLDIVVALTFIGLPFVVRTVQPVLENLDPEVEEAAASLGASRWSTVRRVLFPTVWPALLTGFTLAFARAVGEYGSVVFIAGNMPMKTEIASLLIMTKLEQFDEAGAASIAVVMLLASFVLLLTVNGLQAIARRRTA